MALYKATRRGREQLSPKEEAEFLAVREKNLKPSIIKRLAALRYEKETSGITINGMHIDSSRESQILITNMALKAMSDPSFSVKFKANDGQIADVDANTAIAIYNSLFEYIQGCREREAELIGEVNQSQISEVEQININFGWPDTEITV